MCGARGDRPSDQKLEVHCENDEPEGGGGSGGYCDPPHHSPGACCPPVLGRVLAGRRLLFAQHLVLERLHRARGQANNERCT